MIDNWYCPGIKKKVLLCITFLFLHITNILSRFIPQNRQKLGLISADSFLVLQILFNLLWEGAFCKFVSKIRLPVF